MASTKPLFPTSSFGRYGPVELIRCPRLAGRQEDILGCVFASEAWNAVSFRAKGCQHAMLRLVVVGNALNDGLAAAIDEGISVHCLEDRSSQPSLDPRSSRYLDDVSVNVVIMIDEPSSQISVMHDDYPLTFPECPSFRRPNAISNQ